MDRIRDMIAEKKMVNSKYLKAINYIALIYVIFILGVFPLIYRDYYFDILAFKYQVYYISTIILMVAVLIVGVIFCIEDQSKYGGELRKAYFKSKGKKLFSIPELALICFMLIAIISTLQSDYRFESFWGNEGRYTGCFLLLIYGIGTLIVCRGLLVKKGILNIFLAAGMAECIFGITDYFQMDLLNFKVDMDPIQYNMFAGTIGNVNSYTSYVALVMGVAAVFFATEKIGWKLLVYYICMVISFFAIVMGLSDNSYLALGALFAFLPLYLFRTKTGVKRYVLILATFSGVIYSMDVINRTMSDRVLKMEGILQKLSGMAGLEYMVAAIVMFCILVYVIAHFIKSGDEDLGHKWQLIWLAFLVFSAAAVICVLIDVNIAGNVERYGGIGAYLKFNDDWGTHRGYNWRIGIENYSRFSPMHKIFGFGPDTYGIITHFNNFDDMLGKYQEVYDSAHNEYLQYFITMGPVSLISYMTMLISGAVLMIKKAVNSPCVIACLFSVICYAAQATVNISVPIVAPIMFTLLAVGLAGARKDAVS